MPLQYNGHILLTFLKKQQQENPTKFSVLYNLVIVLT